jgi:hypothetical protein
MPTPSIQWTVQGADEFAQKLKAAKGHVDVHRIMTKSCLEVIAFSKKHRFIRASKTSAPAPGKLTSRTGGSGLMGSIRHEVKWRGREDILGIVGVPRQATGAKYARIHEEGGNIYPVKAKALRFQLFDGKWIVTRKVTMPARPYLEPALWGSEYKVRRTWEAEVDKGLQKAGLK